MAYYDRLGVEAIDSGLVTIRQPAGPAAPWFCADDTPESMTFPAGGDIVRRFEAEDFLVAHDSDEALLGTAFRLAADVRLDQQYAPGGGGWEHLGGQLRRVEGLHWAGAVDAAGAAVLGRCDGTHTMARLLDDLAATLGPEAAELAARWPATVRRLLQCGFLLPDRPNW